MSWSGSSSIINSFELRGVDVGGDLILKYLILGFNFCAQSSKQFTAQQQEYKL